MINLVKNNLICSNLMVINLCNSSSDRSNNNRIKILDYFILHNVLEHVFVTVLLQTIMVKLDDIPLEGIITITAKYTVLDILFGYDISQRKDNNIT